MPNSTATGYDEQLNFNIISRVAIGDLLRRRSRSDPYSEAVVEFIDGQRIALNYSELNSQANQIARGLRANGLQRGDKLALLGANSNRLIALMFACFKAGIVVVPINYLQNLDDIRYNFEHGEVKALAYDPAMEPLSCKCARGLPSIGLKLSLGSASNEADITLSQLLAVPCDDEVLDIIIEDRDSALILYTSGTTSRPKGVEISHLALTLASLNNPLSLGLAPGTKQLNILPLFHTTAINNLFTILQVSGTFVLHQGFDPQAVIETLEREQIQMTVMLPMMWAALLTVPAMKKRDFSHLSTGIYGMAPMNTALLSDLRQTFNCEFHLGSGQTEFTPAPCVFYDQSPTEFGEGNYWGRPTMTTEQAVLDDNGIECATGVVGEICWRGPQSMNGYLKNPEATAQVRTHGWHHSGDLGFVDALGQLMFVDRKKDIIKTGGENVSSCKVEAVLTGLDSVFLAAVVGIPHPRWGEAICAVVQLSPGASLLEATAIDYCRGQLARYEVPKRVIIQTTIAVTSTGKVKKTELRQQYADLFTD
ncbi:MAG: long-chain acyl-CoA synthetase [Paraglaciecola psychrophila]|jgi:long-chain acyl-CoA synthetase